MKDAVAPAASFFSEPLLDRDPELVPLLRVTHVGAPVHPGMRRAACPQLLAQLGFQRREVHGELRGVDARADLEDRARAMPRLLRLQQPKGGEHPGRGRDAGLQLPPDAELEVRQRVAAYAVVLSDRGLLATEYSDRTAVPGRWGMPGGGIDDDEQPADAVLREVAGPHAHYFASTSTPLPVADLIELVLDVAGSPGLRRRVRQRYSWEGIYERLLLPLIREM